MSRQISHIHCDRSSKGMAMFQESSAESGEDSGESSTALGIEEPECVYVYLPASEFGANSL